MTKVWLKYERHVTVTKNIPGKEPHFKKELENDFYLYTVTGHCIPMKLNKFKYSFILEN